MDMFEQIEKEKKDLPNVKSIKKKFRQLKFNGYQKFAIVTYVLCIIFGIILGNLFPSCGSSVAVYNNTCVSFEFNSFLMIGIWFVSLFVCMLFFEIGHIIGLLSSINKNMSK